MTNYLMYIKCFYNIGILLSVITIKIADGGYSIPHVNLQKKNIVKKYNGNRTKSYIKSKQVINIDYVYVPNSYLKRRGSYNSTNIHPLSRRFKASNGDNSNFYVGGALGGSRSSAMFEGTRHIAEKRTLHNIRRNKREVQTAPQSIRNTPAQDFTNKISSLTTEEGKAFAEKQRILDQLTGTTGSDGRTQQVQDAWDIVNAYNARTDVRNDLNRLIPNFPADQDVDGDTPEVKNAIDIVAIYDFRMYIQNDLNKLIPNFPADQDADGSTLEVRNAQSITDAYDKLVDTKNVLKAFTPVFTNAQNDLNRIIPTLRKGDESNSVVVQRANDIVNAYHKLQNTPSSDTVAIKAAQDALDRTIPGFSADRDADGSTLEVRNAQDIVDKLNILNAARNTVATKGQAVIDAQNDLNALIPGFPEDQDADSNTPEVRNAQSIYNAYRSLTRAQNDLNALIPNLQEGQNADGDTPEVRNAQSIYNAYRAQVYAQIALNEAISALRNDGESDEVVIQRAQDMDNAYLALQDAQKRLSQDEYDAIQQAREELQIAGASQEYQQEFDNYLSNSPEALTEEESDAEPEVLTEEQALDKVGDVAMVGFDRWKIGANTEIRAGYELKRDTLYVAAELFAQKLLDDNNIHASFVQKDNGISNSSSMSVNYLYGFKTKIGANVSQKVSVYGIVGMAKTHAEMRTNAFTFGGNSYQPFSSFSRNDVGLVYGAGVSYQAASQVSLTAEFQAIHFANGNIGTNAAPNIDGTTHSNAKALYSPLFKDMGIQTFMIGANFLF